MTVLFAGEVPVHYGFIFLSGANDTGQPDLMAARAGQLNGLCGAALPGTLSMVTGLHTGRVSFTVEWHDTEPPLGDDWDEAVEVPFTPAEQDMVLSSFDDYFPLALPATGDLRARYCASAMDEAGEADTLSEGAPPIDRYLLALWPAAPAPEAILRLTSAIAADWHQEAQKARNSDD